MADTLVNSIRETERANRLKRELTVNISHDLRNPLASLQGYLETLSEKEETLSSEDRMNYLRVMLKDTHSLKRLIDDLFHYSKLESGNLEPEIEAYSQSELAQDVLLKMKPEADKKNIYLEMGRPGELFLVRADIGMIERVLTNLIENGIQNTPSGGTVGIEMERRDGKVITRVFDTGFGIPEEDIHAVFDMFYTGDTSRDRSRPGSGLGLGICKKILELHGEDIRVASTPGKGSVFSFSLPAEDLRADSAGRGETG
jgi:signal transduction histidine kinase